MSTITDALEKKKQEDESKKPKALDLENPPKVAIPRDKRRLKRWILLFIAMIIIGAAVAGWFLYREEITGYLAPLITKFSGSYKSLPPKNNESAKEIVKEKSPDEITPEKKAEPKIEAPKVEFPRLTVEAIIFDPLDPEVLINGQSLKTGDTIEGADIIEIKKDRVRVRFQGEEKTLIFR
jgi:hypothetical protein